MRKPIASIVLALVCFGALPSAIAQKAPAAKKAMFWKVSSDTNVVWLLGSIHLGSKDMYPLASEIEDAFRDAAVLIVEADIRDADMQKMQGALLAKGMYPGDDVLWNHISAETRASVERFCAKYGMPAEMVAKLKPWVVSLTAAALPMMKDGMDPSLGIDYYFLQKANGKRVVEIESAEWQVNLISGFSDDLQDKFLAASVEDAASVQTNLKRLQDAWSAGDAARLDALIRETSRTPEAVTRAMLTDRNPHMADVAEQFLKGKEPAFLVVGAAHMVGKDGVVSLLEKRGYKVEQVAIKK
jgi:uncharacterized protein